MALNTGRGPGRACLLWLIALALVSQGCLYQGAGRSIDEPEVAEGAMDRVSGFPLVLQVGEQDCGAAALSATLQHWGTAIDIAEVRRIAGDEDAPLRADALREVARRKGYDAFLVRGSVEDLREEVRAGRPVIVGMLKPYVGEQWFAHYEVVTAIGAKEIITMDPANGWRRYPLGGFEEEWKRSNHLTMIVAPR
jgi:ABC-type bacteriocin/lantibiotic exporter with double-glycine peptidase domain